MKIGKSITPLSPSTSTSRGFTLLEIVIVLGIIAVILGGSIAVVGKLGDGAKLQRVTSDFNTITSAISTYKINAGTAPTTQQGLQALVVKPASTPIPKRWVQLAKSVPLDPWQNEYIYRFPGKKDPSDFELISKGPDTQEGTEDDLSSQD
ncbi:MAG: type II secretion system major pseudopilin GspG [Armatimonadetes bacterium]|nr:type II secretion system major pseudopilin GspG [Akkermansiaceae bacterium]